MQSIYQDLRFALRQLRRAPGFAVTVIFTLALGIGANAVVFGILNALILRPLNLPQARQLYFLDRVERIGVSSNHSYLNYLDLRERNTAFSGIAASRINILGLDYNRISHKSWYYEASENYFDVLGVKPFLGRFFHPADIHGPGSAPYAVVGYDFWRAHMNADPAVIGKVVELNKHPYTILGVVPPGFIGTELFFRPDVWVPMTQEEQLEGYNFLNSRGNAGIWLTGRLKPGVTAAAATENLNAIARQLARQYPGDEGLKLKLSKPGLLGDTLGRPVAAFLTGIMLLATLVFLAACANLGTLFSARAGDRARELAVRLSLGSSRLRIIRQLVIESLVLSTIGGALGLVASTTLLRLMSQWSPPTDAPIHLAVYADTRSTLLALTLAILSGVFFGLIPAVSLYREDSYQIIKTGSSTGLGHSKWSFRGALLLVQIVLCAILVTASLVAVRGLARSLHTPLGFHPEGVTLASFDLKMINATPEQTLRLQRQATERAATLPGVVSAGFSNTLPLDTNISGMSIYRDDTTDFRPKNVVTGANFFDISPGYLATAQTRLLAGRDFTWYDDAKSPGVVIINQTLARKLFGDAPPIGRYLRSSNSRLQVVGIVEDGKYGTLTEDPGCTIFFPVTQQADPYTTLLVRSSGVDTGVMIPAVAKLLHSLAPDLPVTLETWQHNLITAFFPAAAATVALGVMGALAAMLALTGIFGMASYTVSQRLRELGIRIALGASRKQILAAALKRPVQLLLAGSFAGLVLGALADRLLATIVYQATSRDPIVLLGVLVGMAMVGALAAWVPARRALAIDPARLLREE